MVQLEDTRTIFPCTYHVLNAKSYNVYVGKMKIIPFPSIIEIFENKFRKKCSLFEEMERKDK